MRGVQNAKSGNAKSSNVDRNQKILLNENVKTLKRQNVVTSKQQLLLAGGRLELASLANLHSSISSVLSVIGGNVIRTTLALLKRSCDKSHTSYVLDKLWFDKLSLTLLSIWYVLNIYFLDKSWFDKFFLTLLAVRQIFRLITSRQAARIPLCTEHLCYPK